MKTRSLISLIIKWFILIVVLVAIYLPLITIVIYSFSSVRSVGGDFGEFTFGLYGKLFENEFNDF